MSIPKDLRDRDTEDRLREFGWTIYSRPKAGPVLWQYRKLEIVKTEAEALAWVDREMRRK